MTEASRREDGRRDVLTMFFLPGSRSGSVPGSGLRGGGGGEAQDVAHTLLLEALQRPGAAPSLCQHGLRLQSQPGHLPAGKEKTAAPDRGCCGVRDGTDFRRFHVETITSASEPEVDKFRSFN